MRKILLILFTIAFIFSVYSCSTMQNDTEVTSSKTETTDNPHSYKPFKFGTVEGDYIFARGPLGAPVKYNVHDGKMSYVCPDPFCSHEYDECPFMGCEFFTIGNIVYFTKQDEITGKGTLYSFDVDTVETKAVYSDSGYLSLYFAYEYRLLLRYSSSSQNNSYGYYFWYDTKTGNTEELDFKDVPKNYLVYEIIDDRIIWKPMFSNNQDYYSTDLKGADFKIHDFKQKYGNYYTVETEINEYGYEAYSLYVIYNGETEKTLLLKGVGPCICYENKIVYFKYVPPEEQRVIHVNEDGSVDKDPFGGNVYVINPDGTDNHLLLHADELIMGMTSDRTHPQVCGDYFGIMIAEYGDDDGISRGKLIIANINTGEFVITHE